MTTEPMHNAVRIVPDIPKINFASEHVSEQSNMYWKRRWPVHFILRFAPGTPVKMRRSHILPPTILLGITEWLLEVLWG